MTEEEWKQICNDVTEAMREHTAPFVTPLLDKTILVGSGNYLLLNDEKFIATCQHVAKRGQLDYRFFGLNSAFNSHSDWVTEPLPIDLAIAKLLHGQWDTLDHHAELVPFDRFAQRHAPVDCHEILFFRGYAFENSASHGTCSEANASAYSSQEKKESSDMNYFEIFWEPKNTQYTTATTDEEQAKLKCEYPHGFSGSLVWNTRYWEVTEDRKNKWTPENAVVTGMVHRWDECTNTLLCYRVEHIREFIDTKLNPPA